MSRLLLLCTMLVLSFSVIVPVYANEAVDKQLFEAAKSGDIKTIKDAIEDGGNVNARTSDGFTPLHLASWFQHENVVSILIDSRADINAINHYGDTALHYAAAWGNMNITELLINKGAAINTRNSKNITPLGVAYKANRQSAIRLLQQHGASL